MRTKLFNSILLVTFFLFVSCGKNGNSEADPNAASEDKLEAYEIGGVGSSFETEKCYEDQVVFAIKWFKLYLDVKKFTPKSGSPVSYQIVFDQKQYSDAQCTNETAKAVTTIKKIAKDEIAKFETAEMGDIVTITLTELDGEKKGINEDDSHLDGSKEIFKVGEKIFFTLDKTSGDETLTLVQSDAKAFPADATEAADDAKFKNKGIELKVVAPTN